MKKKNTNSQNFGKDIYVPWKKVLLKLYDSAPNYYGESDKEPWNSNKHPLAKNLKISGYELCVSIIFLKDQKLVFEWEKIFDKTVKNKSIKLELTEKGFNVAMDLEKHKDTEIFNVALFFLTLMLVLSSIISVMFSTDNAGIIVFITIVYSVLFLVFMFILTYLSKKFY
ncbi:MAG: hypothetical protein AB7V77_00665 [Candidatus Woesearchaeota archaeon]